MHSGKVNPQVTLFVVEVKYGLTGTEAEDAAKQHVSLDLVDVKHPDFTTVAALNPGACLCIRCVCMCVSALLRGSLCQRL